MIYFEFMVKNIMFDRLLLSKILINLTFYIQELIFESEQYLKYLNANFLQFQN